MRSIVEPVRPVRKEIDRNALEELAKSMKIIGQLQPILLRDCGEKYEIEAGHRRFLAAKSIGWDTIEAVVLPKTPKDEAHVERAHENLIREDINHIEEAEMVKVLVYEQNRGIEETAELVGKTVSWVERRLEILDYPPEIKDELGVNKLSLAQAKELSKCRDPLLRESLLRTVVSSGAAAATIKRWVYDPEVEEKIKSHQDMSTALSATPISSGTLKLTCHLCQELIELAKMKHVWLCPGCMADTVGLRYIIMEDKKKGEESENENIEGEKQ